jgi:hypothetical protein
LSDIEGEALKNRRRRRRNQIWKGFWGFGYFHIVVAEVASLQKGNEHDVDPRIINR